MPDFKKNSRFGQGGPRRDFGSRDFGGPKQMFDAECANCRTMTQVPFKPNGMKPVYCRDCFKPDESRGSAGPRFEKKSFGPPRRDFAPRPPAPDSRIDDISRKLDRVTATLEKLAEAMEKSQRASELTAVMKDHAAPAKAKAAPKAAKKKAKKSK